GPREARLLCDAVKATLSVMWMDLARQETEAQADTAEAGRIVNEVLETLKSPKPEQAVTNAMVKALRNIDAEAPAKEPRDDWTSTDLDEAFYEGKLRGFWEMAVYAREALTAALGAQTPPEGAVMEAQGRRPTGRVQIAHDGFSGDIIGHYITREGKRGVVVQQ